jgi:hypothetical protein
MMNSNIAFAESEREVLDCYPAMAELRPQIKRDEFVSTVKRLSETVGGGSLECQK